MSYDVIFYRGRQRVAHIPNVVSILHMDDLPKCIVITSDRGFLVPGRDIPEDADHIRIMNRIEEDDINGNDDE